MLAVLALACSWWLYCQWRGDSLRCAWAAALLPAMAAVLLGEIAEECLAAPEFEWNSARLAVAFALKQGHILYPGPGAGPVLGHIYGPVPAYVYQPAAWFSTPEAALTCGALISFVLIFAAAALAHLTMTAPGASRLRAMWGLSLFCGLALLNDALRSCWFSVHVDAAMIAFSVAACACIGSPARRQSAGWVAGSAVFAALAVWSKQTAAPLLVALPLYLLLIGHRRLALRHLLATLGIAAALGALFAARFGFDGLWYNLFTIPSHHPWLGSLTDPTQGHITGGGFASRLSVLWQAATGLALRVSLPVALLLAVVTLEYFCARRGHGGVAPSSVHPGLRDWLAARPWTLLVFTAAFCSCTALLGRVKVGGYVNAYGQVVCLVTLASTVALANLAAELARLTTFQLNAGSLRVMAGLCIAITVTAGFQVPGGIHRQWLTRDNSLSHAMAYVRQHPGELYFPWNPLIPLMAEGRAYHLGYGVYDRGLAGAPLSEQMFHAYLPEKLDGVAYRLGSHRLLLKDRFPAWRRVELPPELPGWLVFRRGNAPATVSSIPAAR